jgi:hypothetical protein
MQVLTVKVQFALCVLSTCEASSKGKVAVEQGPEMHLQEV